MNAPHTIIPFNKSAINHLLIIDQLNKIQAICISAYIHITDDPVKATHCIMAPAEL
jgi:hypothetical protein